MYLVALSGLNKENTYPLLSHQCLEFIKSKKISVTILDLEMKTKAPISLVTL